MESVAAPGMWRASVCWFEDAARVERSWLAAPRHCWCVA